MEQINSTKSSHFPTDCNIRWNVPNVITKSFEDYYGLILFGTTSPDYVNGKEDKMPQSPAKVIGLEPPRETTDSTDFPAMVNSLAYQISIPLEAIVRDYATLVSVFSCLCNRWIKEGRDPLYPVPPGYTQKKFEDHIVKNAPPPDERPATVKDFTTDLFKSLRQLKNVFEDQGDWEDFPNQWPLEPTMDGEYKITARLPTHWQFRNVVVTVRFIMDTQHYRVPRGFSIEVTGDETSTALVGDDSPSSSSCSSAYSCSSSALGDEVHY